MALVAMAVSAGCEKSGSETQRQKKPRWQRGDLVDHQGAGPRAHRWMKMRRRVLAAEVIMPVF
ncbi:MAG: hypothetical protein Q8O26_14145 [Phreatobacter sp.]|uniref:hypothetical protein n=1 Tax=Phreatobacter sp. TaxID=1966341 RepID=UPI002735D813|nr:hypothetical protein [Phreatobacter sp.]MDP2803014.1 hypothetical protein [Phreatobacter sp.]